MVAHHSVVHQCPGLSLAQRLPNVARNLPKCNDKSCTVEEIAEVLDAADLKPPDFMPVDLAAQLSPLRVIDANELLWSARILAGLVRVHRNVIPDMREKVKLAQAILESYADVADFDPRD